MRVRGVSNFICDYRKRSEHQNSGSFYLENRATSRRDEKSARESINPEKPVQTLKVSKHGFKPYKPRIFNKTKVNKSVCFYDNKVSPNTRDLKVRRFI